jgi:hypothetical protein
MDDDKRPMGVDLVNVMPRFDLNETKEEYWERYREEYRKVYGEYPETPPELQKVR